MEDARELQHPVERRIEGADLFSVRIGHADARKFFLPRRLRLGLRRIEAVVADFGAQVQQRLFGADEGGGDADVDLIVLLRLEAEHRADMRSEEHTSELQSLMRISYAVFCLKKKKKQQQKTT